MKMGKPKLISPLTEAVLLKVPSHWLSKIIINQLILGCWAFVSIHFCDGIKLLFRHPLFLDFPFFLFCRSANALTQGSAK